LGVGLGRVKNGFLSLNIFIKCLQCAWPDQVLGTPG
jgi:hypothetical protein